VAFANRWLVVNGAGSDRFPAATPSSPAAGARGPMRACSSAPPRTRTAPIRAWQVLRGPGRASAQPLPPQRGRARLRRAARAVAACVDTYVPELPYCTYGLRVPITPSCCTYPGRRAACPGTAAVRNAYRGTPGGTRACGRPCSAGRSGPSWRASRARAALSTCASTTAEPRRGRACRPSATARRRRHRCSSSSSSTCSGGPNP
jgi:hypothetical protein